MVVMKVQCDVCKGEEAAVIFCCADEAALCAACDARIHGADKVAGRHRRFSLHPPSSPHHFPLICDVCQEKRAMLFCLQDRAVLCWDCDVPIHDANDLTRKHSRFLLTGVGLSPSPAAGGGAPPADNDIHSSAVACAATDSGAAPYTADCCSSISEYLMRELPGWLVEDLLLESCDPAVRGATFVVERRAPLFEAPDTSSAVVAAAGAAFTAYDSRMLPACCVPTVPHFDPSLPTPQPPFFGYNHNQSQLRQQEAAPAAVFTGDLTASSAWQLQQHQMLHRRAADDGFTVPNVASSPSTVRCPAGDQGRLLN